MNDRRKTGDKGEDLAVSFLRKKGYKIIDRNFRSKAGEIDIIARSNNVLVFIEVKTRHSTQFGLPEDAVSESKLRKIMETAYFYINVNKLEPKEIRIDVVSIEYDQDRLLRIEQYENVTQ